MNNDFIEFDTILDQARRLIAGQFTKRRRVLPDNINCILRKMRNEGMQNSGPEDRAARAACEEETDERAKIVWASIQRAHEAVGSPMTNTLAKDLKQEVNLHIEKIVKYATELMAKRLRLTEPNTELANLEKTQSEVKKEYEAEVDLYVASLLCKPPGKGVPMSKALSSAKWGVIFGVSRSTMRRWREEKKYPFVPISERKWSLPISKLPGEYLLKYEQHSKPKKS